MIFGIREYIIVGLILICGAMAFVININRTKNEALRAQVSELTTKIEVQNIAIKEASDKRDDLQKKFDNANSERKQVQAKFDAWLKDLAGRPLATNCPDAIGELKIEMSKQFKEWKK